MVNTHVEQLVLSIAPTGCHLINLPKRIWVFGGPIAIDTGHPCESLRDSFWRQQLAAIPSRPWFEYLDRPENHPGWWAFSGYDNLLEFERDACYLASQMVVFSESPGSHAELGALAADSSILPRLMVVVQQKFLEDDWRESFLNLGPIRRVELLGRKCVIGTESDHDLEPDDFQVIVESFDASFAGPQHRRVELNPENPTHRLLLIADLVDLLLVSKVSDINAALLHFSIQIQEAELLKALNLLNFFGLVRLEMRGYEPFWVRKRSSDAPWIDYRSVTHHVPFDRSRFKIERQNSLATDQRRNSILQQVAA